MSSKCQQWAAKRLTSESAFYFPVNGSLLLAGRGGKQGLSWQPSTYDCLIVNATITPRLNFKWGLFVEFLDFQFWPEVSLLFPFLIHFIMGIFEIVYSYFSNIYSIISIGWEIIKSQNLKNPRNCKNSMESLIWNK